MGRTNPEITDQEGQIYERFCNVHGIPCGNTQAALDNATYIRDYFLKTWNEDITEANLTAALSVIRPHLKFHEQHEADYEKLQANMSAEERQAYKAWRGERGLKDSYRNAVAILSWLKAHSFKVTEQNLHLAVGQKVVYPHLEWDDSARPRYDNPRQHKDDGKGFLPKDEVNLSPRDHARKNQEAAAKNNPTAVDSISVLEGQARREAESMTGSTHGGTEQLRRVFVMKPGSSDIDWTATLVARKRMQNSLKRDRSIR